MTVKKILVSQPVPAIPEKSPFFEISRKHGVQIDYNPLIKVQGVSLKEFRSQRVEILTHTAVIFTSRTTVDSFFRICEEARINVPETMKYICQTEAVALYLQKYIVYRKRKIFFADGSFTNFLELIIKHKDEKYLPPESKEHEPFTGYREGEHRIGSSCGAAAGRGGRQHPHAGKVKVDKGAGRKNH